MARCGRIRRPEVGACRGASGERARGICPPPRVTSGRDRARGEYARTGHAMALGVAAPYSAATRDDDRRIPQPEAPTRSSRRRTARGRRGARRTRWDPGRTGRRQRERSHRRSAHLVRSLRAAEIVPDLASITDACERTGARLLVDAYHHLNVVPFDLRAMHLEAAFVTGGGYKYCQLGEGNAFLRVPPHEHLRPVLTGWFAESREAACSPRGRELPGGRRCLHGSHGPPHLALPRRRRFRISPGTGTHGRTAARDQPSSGVIAQNAVRGSRCGSACRPCGRHARRAAWWILAIRSRDASGLAAALWQHGVWSDAQRDLLRLGPAPYLSDEQLIAAVVGAQLHARAPP